MAGRQISIDTPLAGGSVSTTFTVKGHVSGDVPTGSTVTCTLRDPSTAPGASVPELPLSSGQWSCSFTNVQSTAPGKQASVSASLFSGDEDIADCGPVFFTIG
jgi:hypothetical protein